MTWIDNSGDLWLYGGCVYSSADGVLVPVGDVRYS
jgi:hypothetical protein